MQGATAPGTPALNRLRRLQSQRNRHSGGRRIPKTALTVSAHPVEFFPGSRHEPRLLQSYIREKFWGGLGDSFKSPPALLLSRGSSNPYIREKFWGVWGTLSRVPRRFSLAVAPPIIHSRKVLGGLGDSFKSSPALLLPPCGESGGRRRSPCGAEKEGGCRDQEKRRPRGRRSRQNACGQTACRGTAPVSWARARRR